MLGLAHQPPSPHAAVGCRDPRHAPENILTQRISLTSGSSECTEVNHNRAVSSTLLFQCWCWWNQNNGERTGHAHEGVQPLN